MKKSRILLGVSTIILAVASAFSTQSLKARTYPWHHTQPDENGACAQFTNFCTGGTNPVWTQGIFCTMGNMAFTDNGCLHQLLTNHHIR